MSTFSASHTGVPVNLSYAVDNSDRIEIAYVNAVAKAYTSMRAGRVAVKEGLGTGARPHSLPLEDFLGSIACPVTHYLSNLLVSTACRASQDCSNLLRTSCSANRTSTAACRLVVDYCICIVIASGESAAAAVSSGKDFSHLGDSLVYGNVENVRSDYEQERSNEACANYKYYCCHNCIHLYPSLLE